MSGESPHERMAAALDEDDAELLCAAAWLHDVGYAPQLEDVDQARARWYASHLRRHPPAAHFGRGRGDDGEVRQADHLDPRRPRPSRRNEHRHRGRADAAVDVDGREMVETDIADIRDTREPNPDERAVPAPRGAHPTVDETANDVARAQLALQEIENRRRYEQAAEAVQSDELTQWDADDRADTDGSTDADQSTDEAVLER